MRILGFEFGTKNVEAITTTEVETTEIVKTTKQTRVLASSTSAGWGTPYGVTFDGEKNLGELGPVISYSMNYNRLALRSWQSYAENDITKTILPKLSSWIVDKGLKLQAIPNKTLLKSEGIELNSEAFNEVVEARFSTWAKSKKSTHSGNTNFNQLSKEIFKHAKIGGDCLVVLRYIENRVTVQMIDTLHLGCPIGGSKSTETKIVDGVEINKYTGEHVAYHVRKSQMMDYERIPAKDESTGLTIAFLVYGDKYRSDNHRGIPVISTSLETLKKIERYKEAAVGSAEERQKIAFAIEHEIGSDGSSPLIGQLTRAFDSDAVESLPVDETGQQLANHIASTTNKETYNLTPGSKLTQLESRNEMFFKEFYETNANIICAAIGIPPNVAFSIYNDSFSASRAATKDWEHTIDVERDYFTNQLYQNVYSFWLFVEIFQLKIQAPGYIDAFLKNNWMVVEAYSNCRFTGPMFPHIDPLKEVNAERKKLGPLADNIPLTTVEQATEVLNGGDSDSNIQQFSEELIQAKELNVVAPEPVISNPNV
jgi:capsid protein